MPELNLKTSHKPVRDYYAALQQTSQQLHLLHKGAIAPHFANLLRACASRVGWTLQEQFQIPRKGQRPLRVDGVLLDSFKLRHGVWEAKDRDDETYILRLIKQVISISLETVEIVNNLPPLKIIEEEIE